jgi:hypothetical protein
MHTRISRYVHDPLTATALALETRSSGRPVEQAILISLDAAGRDGILEAVRDRVRAQLPGFDDRKILLNCTHTHTAPETIEGLYNIPKNGVMQPTEYARFLAMRLSEAAIQAWNNRQPAAMSWGLGHAVVGYNRRTVYEGGRAVMYGATDRPDFREIEGYEDHGIHVLVFWNPSGEVTGVAVSVACPSQIVEGEYYVSADFWNDVRTLLRKRYSQKLFVYAMTRASGDQSPRPPYRKRAEQRMRELRELSPSEELARRIARAVDEVMEVAKQDMRPEVPFRHLVEQLDLPARLVTAAEYDEARREYERALKTDEASDPKRGFTMYFKKQVIDRYERQKRDPRLRSETHILRIGDVAIATNPFELFLDYGVAIEARSKAEQTLVVQLAPGQGGYLPTRKAVAGGSYSAMVESNPVGPEGGQVLVDRTVELINSMWEER